MKAVFYTRHGGPDVLEYGELPEPQPESGWARIRVLACALNHLDILSRRGLPGIAIPLPGIGGGDCVGVVDAVGDDADAELVGTRMLINPAWFADGRIVTMGENFSGAMAEYCVAPVENLIPVPDSVADVDAAALPIAYGTAHRMLRTRVGLGSGQTILVLGASGGVGTACVLLAKALGATVIAAAGSAAKCEVLRRIGADETIDYSSVAVDDHCRATTGSFLRGGGYDVVVNYTGGDTWTPSLRCVKVGGTLVTCGASAGHNPVTDLRYLWTGELNVIGSNGWRTEDLTTLLDLVAAGELRPLIDRVVPLADGVEAYRALEAREVVGKIVIAP